jgi:hypothetical protein
LWKRNGENAIVRPSVYEVNAILSELGYAPAIRVIITPQDITSSTPQTIAIITFLFILVSLVAVDSQKLFTIPILGQSEL